MGFTMSGSILNPGCTARGVPTGVSASNGKEAWHEAYLTHGTMLAVIGLRFTAEHGANRIRTRGNRSWPSGRGSSDENAGRS